MEAHPSYVSWVNQTSLWDQIFKLPNVAPLSQGIETTQIDGGFHWATRSIHGTLEVQKNPTV